MQFNSEKEQLLSNFMYPLSQLQKKTNKKNF